MTGFLSGVAVIIVIHQLPDFLGLPSTGGSNTHRIGFVFTHLGQVNGWTVAIGLGVLAVMFVSAHIDRRIPAAHRPDRIHGPRGGLWGCRPTGVAVLGTIQSGAPKIGLTGLSWSTLDNLAPLAAVVALVVVTQTAATTRGFAEQGGYDVDAGARLPRRWRRQRSRRAWWARSPSMPARPGPGPWSRRAAAPRLARSERRW